MKTLKNNSESLAQFSRGVVQKTASVLAALSIAMTPSVNATLPTNPNFSYGSGSYTVDGNVGNLALDSASIIDWQQFGIARDNTLVISGADSLHRVASGLTRIDGTLSSDSQVFIINPNGVVVGSTGAVDAAGFVASSLNISDADFLAGNLQFSGAGANVSNAGAINAGLVVLVGSEVSNSGSIAGGEVVLGGAEGYLMVDPASGDWSADGAGVAVNTGDISASGVAYEGGRILLVTNTSEGIVANSGSISVDGGFVETSGANFGLAVAPQTNGGQWLIDPVLITVTDSKTDGAPLGSVDPTVLSGNVGDDVISAALTAGSTVTLETTGPDADILFNTGTKVSPAEDGAVLNVIADGDITFASTAKISKKSDFTLDLNLSATETIVLNDGVAIDTGDAGNIGMVADGNIEFNAGTGKINVDTRGGNFSAFSTAGDILIDTDAGGKVAFKTRGGSLSMEGENITITPADNAVQFDTGGAMGDLSFTAFNGDFNFDAGASGKLQVKTRGGDFTIIATNDILFDLDTGSKFQLDSGVNGGDFGDVIMQAGGAIKINEDGEGQAQIDSRGGNIEFFAFTGDPATALSQGTLSELNAAFADDNDNDIVLNVKARTRGGHLQAVSQGDIIVGSGVGGATSFKGDLRGDGGSVDLVAVGDIILNGTGTLRTGVGANTPDNNIQLRGDSVTLTDLTVDANGGLISVFATAGVGDLIEDSDVVIDRSVAGKGARLRHGTSANNSENVGGVVIFAEDDVTISGANNSIEGRGGNISIVAGGDFTQTKVVKTQVGPDDALTLGNIESRGDIDIVVGGNFYQVRDTVNDTVAGKGRGTISTDDGNVDIDVAGDLFFNSKSAAVSTKGGVYLTDGDISITTGGDMFILTSILAKASGGDIALESTGGNVYIGGDATANLSTDALAAVPNTDYAPFANVQIKTATKDLGGSLSIVANESVILSSGDNVAKKNKVEARASGSNGQVYLFAETGDVNLSAPAPVAAADAEGNGITVRSNAALRMYAPAGDILVSSSSNATKTKIEVRSDGTVLDLVAAGDIKFEAGDSIKSDVVVGIAPSETPGTDVATFSAGGDIIFANGASGSRSFFGRSGQWGGKDNGTTITTNVLAQAGGDIQLAQDVTVSKGGNGTLTLAANGTFADDTQLFDGSTFSTINTAGVQDADGEGAFVTNLASLKTNGLDQANTKSIFFRTGTGAINVTAVSNSTRTGDLVVDDFLTAEGSHFYNGGTGKVPDTITTIGFRTEGAPVNMSGLGHVMINESSRNSDANISIQADGGIMFGNSVAQKGNDVVPNTFTFAAGTGANGDILFREKTQIQSSSTGVPATNVVLSGGGDLVMQVFDNKNQVKINQGNLKIDMGGDVETPRITLSNGNLDIDALGGVTLGRLAVTGSVDINAGTTITQNERTVVSGGPTTLDAGGDITLVFDNNNNDITKALNEFGGGVKITQAEDVVLSTKIGLDLIGTGTVGNPGPDTMVSANVWIKGNVTESAGGWQATNGTGIVAGGLADTLTDTNINPVVNLPNFIP